MRAFEMSLIDIKKGSMKTIIRINERDNVVVALKPLKEGTTIQIGEEELVLKDNIPQGHKIAIALLSKGADIIKYGNKIGTAIEEITPGSWVHIHNVKTGLDDRIEYTFNPVEQKLDVSKGATFLGYQREDGKVGVRNDIWIIPTVGCVNKVGAAIEKAARLLFKDNAEEIIAYQHPYGCSQMGEDQELTRKILSSLILHPNAGGVLVLGLGCENSNIRELKKYIGNYNSHRVKFLVAQECEDEVEEGVRLIEELIEYTSQDKRTSISTTKLIVGLKCGGSDGLSGITANPVVGRFSDMLISTGGTTILTEVPEMFGAETLLMNRCKNEALFHKLISMINHFKQYFKNYNQTIYENPSPGNKEGGITTLEDKSLGCIQKSGSASVSGIIEYGDGVQQCGLNLLSSPGNDLVASTALAAAGAQIVLFTTGRGTPFASPVPTVKISSNAQLYDKKHNWIDFDAGKLLESGSIHEIAQELFEYVLKVASGDKVKSELAGYHDLAIFKQGVTL